MHERVGMRAEEKNEKWNESSVSCARDHDYVNSSLATRFVDSFDDRLVTDREFLHVNFVILQPNRSNIHAGQQLNGTKYKMYFWLMGHPSIIHILTA